MRYLGKTAQRVRRRLAFTQEAMALALDISVVHLSNIENDKAMPSPTLLNKFSELSGVDIYVLDWCENPNTDDLPSPVRAAAEKLRNAWRKQIDIEGSTNGGSSGNQERKKSL